MVRAIMAGGAEWRRLVCVRGGGSGGTTKHTKYTNGYRMIDEGEAKLGVAWGEVPTEHTENTENAETENAEAENAEAIDACGAAVGPGIS